MRGGEGGCPLEVFRLYGDGLDHEFNTDVAHITNVGKCLVIHVWRHRHTIPVKQVVSGLHIDIQRTVNAIVQHTIVETEVPLLGGLPLQVGVRVLRNFKGLDPLAIH